MPSLAARCRQMRVGMVLEGTAVPASFAVGRAGSLGSWEGVCGFVRGDDVSCAPWSLGKKGAELQKSIFELVKRCGGALQISPSPHSLEIRRGPLDP